MRRVGFWMAAALLAAGVNARAADSDALAVLRNCRAMLPQKEVELEGRIILRNRKGIPSGEYGYTLKMNRQVAPATLDIEVREGDSTNVLERVALKRPGNVPEGRIMKTDVKWTDLALDFLWWPKAEYEQEREGESVHGQVCTVLIVTSETGARARLWVDKKNGCLMQAEELDSEGRSVRRLWGTRIKKFGERWIANVLEAETLGSGHRTKITVEDVR